MSVHSTQHTFPIFVSFHILSQYFVLGHSKSGCYLDQTDRRKKACRNGTTAFQVKSTDKEARILIGKVRMFYLGHREHGTTKDLTEQGY